MTNDSTANVRSENFMTPRDLFGVAIRILGCIVLGFALFYFIDAIVLYIDPEYFAKTRPGVVTAPASHYLRNGVACLLVGGYLLRGGKFLVRFAYGKETP
jgi:hypothetical protein